MKKTIGFLLLLAGTVFGAEFYLLDVHGTTSSPYTYYENVAGATSGSAIPYDWLQPVDYMGGWYQCRFVIHRMGNGQYPNGDISLLLTIRDGEGSDDAHAWESYTKYYKTDIGKGVVVEFYFRLLSGFWTEVGEFSWRTDPAARIRIQPRVKLNKDSKYVDINKTQTDFKEELAKSGKTYEEVAAWFFPLEFDYQTYMVSKGSEFSGWDKHPFKSGFTPPVTAMMVVPPSGIYNDPADMAGGKLFRMDGTGVTYAGTQERRSGIYIRMPEYNGQYSPVKELFYR